MPGGLDKAQTGSRNGIFGMPAGSATHAGRARHKRVAAPRETAYFDSKITWFHP